MDSTKKIPHVVFVEGADGVGKSSVVKALVNQLNNVVGVPTTSALIMQSHQAGYYIRQSNVTEEMSDELRFVGYCYGTFYGIDKIFENKDNSSVIIVDRSQASTFAQNICAPEMDALMKNAAVQIFNKLNNNFKEKYCGKYTNVYLEVDSQVALNRIADNRGLLDVFEKRGVKFQEKIKAGYESYYTQHKNPLHLRFMTDRHTPDQMATYIIEHLVEKIGRHALT